MSSQGKLASYLRLALEAAADAEDGPPPIAPLDLDRLALALTRAYSSTRPLTYRAMSADLCATARVLKIAAAQIDADLLDLQRLARDEGRPEPT